MHPTISYHDVSQRLQENALPYGELELQNDVRVIITQRGGRILGPFLNKKGNSLLWINPAFAEQEAFRAFLDAGEWNLGGERIWVAPEIQYSVHDRTDFWGSIQLPKQMDPGHHKLEAINANMWTLTQDLTLQAHNLATGQKNLRLERWIHRAEDPLRNLGSYHNISQGVIFAGYEQIVKISEDRRNAIMSESWNLAQLNPGGQVLIPTTTTAEYTDYFEAIDAQHQIITPNYVRLKITGDRRYKVGYKAAHLFGRLAYINHLEDGRALLMVRNYFNNPTVPYVEEPATPVGCRGHSVHIYNDGGMFGGFGELECNGQTMGGDTGRSSSTDSFGFWLYIASEDKIRQILLHLLGITL